MSFKLYLGAAAVVALTAFGSAANAVTCSATATECSADLNIISASNIGSGSQGTVDAKVVSATEIEISVALTSGVKFINSGGPHTPFVYNLNSLLTGLTVAIDTTKSGSLPQAFNVLSGSQSATPYGTFTNGIGVNGGNGSGPTVGNTGPLYFTVTATGGITLADLLANTDGYFFAADVYGTGGNTGSVAANLFSCVAGCTGPGPGPGPTPLPGALWLFGTVLAGAAGYKKYGKSGLRMVKA
jgi:hypothetical protein